jgi:hypothetical protein
MDIFPNNSRYHEIETTKLVTDDGQEIIYLKRRFVPDGSVFADLTEHVVSDGERLDNITAQYLGDPTQFWQLTDANNVLHPDELIAEIGRRIRIPLLQGVR